MVGNVKTVPNIVESLLLATASSWLGRLIGESPVLGGCCHPPAACHLLGGELFLGLLSSLRF